MSFAVGIGIVTYKRPTILAHTIERVRALTSTSDAALVVADDGSADGTVEMLRDMRVPVVTGVNMGIAWNKNRALFLLAQLLHCETVILLEDDIYPTRHGWEHEWALGATLWGHVNLAGFWFKEQFVSGSGTAEDPILSTAVTAQCSAYSAVALSYAGYFHPRFSGYGHEHVEHTRRLIRNGYGGSEFDEHGREQVLFRLLNGDFALTKSQSFHNQEQVQRNWTVARDLISGCKYSQPWETRAQLGQFRHEMETALSGGAEGFRLTTNTTRQAGSQRSPFSRLFLQV